MSALDYRIVVGIDGSPGSDRALELVRALPVRPHDEVIVATRPRYILEVGASDVGKRLAATARSRAQVLVDAEAAKLVAAGVRARGLVCEGVDAVEALLVAADSERASILVVGSRGRGPWASILLGSTARALAMLSPHPVLVVRGRGTAPQRVLAATDGSPAAHAAIDAFARFPQTEGVVVELLSVLPLHDWSEDEDEETLAIRESVEHDEEDAVNARLESERALVGSGIQTRTQMERGHVAETILRRADDIGADLIVVGTRGVHGPRPRFWGSTAEHVLTQASCDVLIAPVGRDEPLR